MGSLLARANSTAFIVTAHVASIALIVSAGFIAHLHLLGAHISQLTTKEKMDVVEPNPMISDERMDVDSSNNNNEHVHTFLSSSTFISQTWSLWTVERWTKGSWPTSARSLASSAVGTSPLLSSASASSAAIEIYGKGKHLGHYPLILFLTNSYFF